VKRFLKQKTKKT